MFVSLQRFLSLVIHFVKLENKDLEYCFPLRRYPYFDVVVGLVWSHDPKSYAGGSICYW
jgi:hypothetical protein